MVITYLFTFMVITYFVYIYGDYIFVFVVMTPSEDGVYWSCSEAPREEIA